MKKILVVAMLSVLVMSLFVMGVIAAAPNSGDCEPDGSGWGEEIPHPGDDADGPGPAPNAGDGIPDGSGF